MAYTLIFLLKKIWVASAFWPLTSSLSYDALDNWALMSLLDDCLSYVNSLHMLEKKTKKKHLSRYVKKKKQQKNVPSVVRRIKTQIKLRIGWPESSLGAHLWRYVVARCGSFKSAIVVHYYEKETFRGYAKRKDSPGRASVQFHWGAFAVDWYKSQVWWLIVSLDTEHVYPASILRKSTSGRHRPVSYPDGPMTARYRFT